MTTMRTRLSAPFLAIALTLGAGVTIAEELESVDRVAAEDAPFAVRLTIAEAFEDLDRAREIDIDDDTLAGVYGQLGNVLMAHGYAAEARSAYTNAGRLAPRALDWPYLLGVLETGEGRIEAAIGHFDRALEISSWEAPVLIRRGRAHLEAGNFDAAETDFERVRRLDPDSAAALAGLGRVSLEREAYNTAVDRLERALEISPEADRLYQPLGMAYRGLGDTEQARRYLDRAGQREPEFRDPIVERVQSQSRSPQFYLEAALSQADQGNLDASLRLLVNALSLEPGNTRVLRNYVEVLARLGEFDEARTAARRLIELDGESAEAHYLLGQIEEFRGQIEPARAAYEDALARDAQLDDAREALVFLRMREGDFDAAGARFSEMAEAADQPAQRQRMVYWQAVSRLGAEDCSGARELFHEARALVEEFDGPIMSALARIRASCGQASDDELSEALAWAEMVYDLAPDMESAATLAMVHAAMGQFDDAVDFQAQAIFEALRDGTLDDRPDLQADMTRYQEERVAEVPYGPEHPLFAGGLYR